MSSDETPSAQPPRERRDAVREKAQQVRAQQSRARTARITAMVVGAVAVVAVAAVAITWTVASTAAKPLLNPVNATGDGFVVTEVSGVGLVEPAGSTPAGDETPTPTATPSASSTPDATPTPSATPGSTVDIRVYVDYLSTGSRDFQLANVQQLSKWVRQGAAELTYYPVSMLTAKSNGTKYSLRAAGAAACVATHSPDSFFAFNHALLTQQPEVDSDGYSDIELADLAIASGSERPRFVRSCIEDQAFVGWARNATQRALDELPDTDGLALTGTPTVLVNGTPYVGALDDPKEFAQFVLTVASDAYFQATPTPTPTPTATP